MDSTNAAPQVLVDFTALQPIMQMDRSEATQAEQRQTGESREVNEDQTASAVLSEPSFSSLLKESSSGK